MCNHQGETIERRSFAIPNSASPATIPNYFEGIQVFQPLMIPRKTRFLWVVLLLTLPMACGGPTIFPGSLLEGGKLSQKHHIPHPAIIAHRGASYNAPEGTRPAYLLARELGVDYLELDLQLTRDNALVVFHDEDLKPKTNIEQKFPSRKDCQISDFTWDELQQLDIGSWFNEKYPDRAPRLFEEGAHPLRILKLEDVIEIAQGGTHTPGLYIELKYPPDRHPDDRSGCSNAPPRPSGSFERVLVKTLEKAGWIKSVVNNSEIQFARVIFESFDPKSLERLKALAPNVPRILLVDEIMVKNHGWEALIERARNLGVGIGPWGSSWASDPNWSREHAPKPYRAIRPDLALIGKFHDAELIVHAWTINDEWEMDEVLKSGADGFFTDRPMQALAIVGRKDSRDIEKLWKKIGY